MARAHVLYEYERTHAQDCPDEETRRSVGDYQVGDLYQCLVCGVWYVAAYESGWTKVRWYHLEAKKRINAIELDR